MTAPRSRTTLLALALIVAASGGRRVHAQVDTVGLLPPGYGTLDLNTITMVMQTSVLEIRFVPLDKRVMRLAKPSVDSAMDQLVARFKTQIQDAADRAGVSTPGLAMVTFYATQGGSQFTPQDLRVVTPGREFAPIGILPFNSNFNSGQLQLRQQASALYVFEQTLPVETSFGIGYGPTSSPDAWTPVLETLNREKSRVQARAAQAPTTPDSAPH
jgi:hypothetical protein